ncbi:MAG: neutral zinc metallopeptidase, partial [Pyrinomonadaceae bacterium]
MRWRGRRQSTNVEDRRGISPGGIAVGGGLGTVVLIVLALLFGADPRMLLEQVQTGGGGPAPGAQQTSRSANPEEEELKQFTYTVLADTEDVWNNIFRQAGREYREPTLVIFANRVDSACGMAGSASGPFYCPGDQRVYIDLVFYRQLRSQFRAPGDFAQAYV